MEILGPLFKVASTPLHCVRCHKTYIESGNHDDACVIRCHGEGEYIRQYHDLTYGYFKSPCCGKIFTETNHRDICLTDWHTTDPTEVEYCEGTEEDEEEGLDVEGSRMIVTCRLQGCNPIP